MTARTILITELSAGQILRQYTAYADGEVQAEKLYNVAKAAIRVHEEHISEWIRG
jgi:hypothetical protein